ncbi:MAG: 3-dehydroquinate synthase [Gammaproteobacteria bacterium]|nr:3-dehydroquinate synthase [Gammaproteobacteria bacterium]
MFTVVVELGDRSYPIHIGSGLLASDTLLRQTLQGRRVMVVSNDRVAPLYLDAVLGALDPERTATCILPDGEQHKTLASVERIVTDLLQRRFGRDCVLLALGGGVVGDLTGFAAAVYQRGVDFVQVPTTLLAQVDSAVGGKTAVNHALGKNMIGAFHQPIAVLSDFDTFATLPAREYRAGLAEVVKYGLISDAAFFAWLQTHSRELQQRDPAALAHAIRRSCEIKAEVVAGDEQEQGRRAILNLGHTFGHALETGLGYGTLLHGEAVAIGLRFALDLSAQLGLADAAEVTATIELLRTLGLPTSRPRPLPADRIIELMGVDKKVRDGRLRFVVVNHIGSAEVRADIAQSMLLKILDRGVEPEDVAQS